MRGLIIGTPLSLAMWWAAFEYGFDGLALVVVIFSVLFLIKNLREDWVYIKSNDEWQDGDTVNYGKDK